METDTSTSAQSELDGLAKTAMKYEVILNAVKSVIDENCDRFSVEDLEFIFQVLHPRDPDSEPLFGLSQEEMDCLFKPEAKRNISQLKELVEEQIEKKYALVEKLTEEAVDLEHNETESKAVLAEIEKVGAELLDEALILYKTLKALLASHIRDSVTIFDSSLEDLKLQAEELSSSASAFEETVLDELFADADVNTLERLLQDLDGEFQQSEKELVSKKEILEKYEQQSEECLAAAAELREIEREILEKLATIAAFEDSSLCESTMDSTRCSDV